MPRGVRTRAGGARSEHLAPRSQGWSRSEGCPPTLRRASEHLGGSPQGPQRRGVGGGHGAPAAQAAGDSVHCHLEKQNLSLPVYELLAANPFFKAGR